MRHHRPVTWGIALLTAAALVLQVLIARQLPAPRALAAALPPAPDAQWLSVISLGEPQALGQGLTLWLQAFDHQPGISMPYTSLDYGRVEAWLDRLLALDARAQYPLLMATHLYGQIPDPARNLRMYEFTRRQFMQDPDRRWPWLAHAAIMAKHRLDNPALALTYADALALHAKGPGVPAWARQMHIFLREEMGDTEAARVLLGGLLASGSVTDEHEKRFLIDRLTAMQQGEISSKAARSRSKAPPRAPSPSVHATPVR